MKKACTIITIILGVISIAGIIFCLAYKVPVYTSLRPGDKPILVGYNRPLLLYSIYFAYATLTSIFAIFAVNGTSKKVDVIAGILYIPVALVVSILMFCIPADEF